MKTIETLPYPEYEKHLPAAGRHIVAQERGDNLLVYQAFNPAISQYAVEHQCFGGSHYSFSRMSWIKPNFLWMMYRAGWAAKPGQERILAIEIPKADFVAILHKAVYANYQEQVYGSREAWQAALQNSDVRLQWDPDHGPAGQALERRAIQLGLRGSTLADFATRSIVSIEDITGFVQEQAQHVASGRLDRLLVMKEAVVRLEDPGLRHFLGIDGGA